MSSLSDSALAVSYLTRVFQPSTSTPNRKTPVYRGDKDVFNRHPVQKNPRFGALDDEAYDQSFVAAFLKHTDQKEVTARQLAHIIGQLKQAFQWPPKTDDGRVSVHDIGCGDGKLTGYLIEALQAALPQQPLHVIGVDPNEFLLKRFKAQLPPALPDSVQLDSIQGDGFQTALKPNSRDFILASHVLYFSTPKQLPDVLKRMEQALKYKGAACIILNTSQSDDVRLGKQFYPDKYYQVNLSDLNTALTRTGLDKRVVRVPVDATVAFPDLEPGGFQAFMEWKLRHPEAKPPNQAYQDTQHLLEFEVHGPLKDLHQSGQLADYLNTVQGLFNTYGPVNGRNRLIHRSEMVLLLGKGFTNDDQQALQQRLLPF